MPSTHSQLADHTPGTRIAGLHDIGVRRAARLASLHEDWLWGGPATPLVIALRIAGDDLEAARILRVALADPRTPDRCLVETLLS